MGLKRILAIVVLGLAGSLVLVPGASAGNFDSDRMGCTGESPAVCPTGTTGSPYSIRVELGGDEDEGCAVFSVSSGALPTGLSLTPYVNESGAGLISGTPTQAGTFDFYLSVKYDREQGCLYEDPPGSGSFRSKTPSDDPFRISINPGLPKLTLGPEATGPGTVGSPYSLQMTASVEGAKTWSINAGSLPPGLTINSSTGLISGTPVTSGQFDFEVLAKMNGDTRSDTKVLGIVVRDRLALVGTDPFNAARRATGEVSVPFDAMLAVTGGSGTYVWSLSSGELPPGVTMTEGAIAGRPTAAGAYRFTVTVTDSEGRVANYPARIVVADKLAISTILLRPGRVGSVYQAKLATTGGVLPRTWRVLTGPLPRGVRFDRVTGQLFGIPTRAGRYRVTFEATDSLGVKAKKTLSIVVLAAPVKKK